MKHLGAKKKKTLSVTDGSNFKYFDNFNKNKSVRLKQFTNQDNAYLFNGNNKTRNTKIDDNFVLLNTPVVVSCRLIFSRMGTINTLMENFDCQAYIECTWEDNKLYNWILNDLKMKTSLPLNSNEEFYESLNSYLKNFKYNPHHFWSPSIYIDNAIGDLKEEKSYKVELVNFKTGVSLTSVESSETKTTLDINVIDVSNIDNSFQSYYTIKVIEMRFINGVFYERLELYDFPLDLQELQITVTSKFPDNIVKIVENRSDPSTISTEVFLNQQEWDLFDYVKCSEKRIYDTFKNIYRPGVSFSSFIARKPGYYVNNAYMLIFLITVLGFVPFSVDVAQPNARMSVAGVLILTQVNFRWIITQRIPSVPYLTSIDKYAIGNLFFLVGFASWHAIIGSQIFDQYSTMRQPIDTYALYVFGALFFMYTVIYMIWFMHVKTKIKRIKENKDEQ